MPSVLYSDAVTFLPLTLCMKDECFQLFLCSVQLVEHDPSISRALGSNPGMVNISKLRLYVTPQRLLVSEMIVRGAKHLFKTFMQGVGMVSLSAAISHYLNCFLGSLPNPQPPKADDEVSMLERWVFRRTFPSDRLENLPHGVVDFPLKFLVDFVESL